MNWIQINWELLIPLCGAVIVTLFEFILKLFQKEPVPTRAYLFVIMLALAGISLTLIAQDRPEIAHLSSHMKADHADGRHYVEDLIDDTLYPLEESLEKKGFETDSLYATNRELMRAISRCHGGETIWAIDYGLHWKSEFKDYALANADCASKGVRITRIFVIPEQTIKNKPEADDLWDEMQEQSRKGHKG
jgi:hypothetical protein